MPSGCGGGTGEIMNQREARKGLDEENTEKSLCGEKGKFVWEKESGEYTEKKEVTFP